MTKDKREYTDTGFEKGYYYEYRVGTIYEGQKGALSGVVVIFTGYLWYYSNSENTICKYDINSGSVVYQLPWPYESLGLTWLRSNLWVALKEPISVSGKTGDIVEVNPGTGDILNLFPSAYGYPGGLASDEYNLWSTDHYPDGDYWRDFFVRYDPDTGQPSIHVGYDCTNALTIYGNYLWYEEIIPGVEDKIVIRDLTTMKEIYKIDCWGVVYDFAVDHLYLWTCRGEDELYKTS